MNTYFVNHSGSLDVDNAFLRRLFEEGWIAIHYPRDKKGVMPELPGNALGGLDNNSLDPLHHAPEAGHVIRRLLTLAREGGYVYAAYRDLPGFVVGKVAPNSEVVLLDGMRGSLYGQSNRKTQMKAVRLASFIVVPPGKFPRLESSRPRQGTLVVSAKVGGFVRDLVERRAVEFCVESLSPPQLETLCAEFLRMERKGDEKLPTLSSLLLPVGRTLRDVDIWGLDLAGRLIFAQVTMHALSASQSKKKLAALKKYAGAEAYLIYFCDVESGSEQDGITVFPIREAFNRFRDTQIGADWMRCTILHDSGE